MFNRLKKINKSQKGFTLIELIMVIAITALIIGGITVSIFQLYKVHASTSSRMLAVRQVQNAGHWISRDVQMAQSMVTDESEDTGFPLTLTWTEWEEVDGHLVEGDEHQVVYTLVEEDSELKRSYWVNDNDPDVTLVAEYIDQAETSCSLTGGGTFTLPDKDDAFTITGGAVADQPMAVLPTMMIRKPGQPPMLMALLSLRPLKISQPVSGLLQRQMRRLP